jgi:hypothetical protein
MEKEFIPYEQALELKELGFDEPCLGSWNFYTKELNYNGQPSTFSSEDVIQLPLYQQVFRWFREKYDLSISITHYENGYSINDLRRFDTYEEAELECIKKLIKIVNTKRNEV